VSEGSAHDASVPQWCAASGADAHLVVAGNALGADLVVDGAAGHHLQRVRRLRAGERVTVADGAGRWRAYVVAAVRTGALDLRAEGAPQWEPVPEPPIAVAIALTKGGIDGAVTACTELGVVRIEPIHTARTVVRLDERRMAAIRTRWLALVHEAAQQSRRARLAEVAPVAPLAALAGRAGLLLADRSGAPATGLGPPPPGGWTVVVGPEGGLALDEVAALGPVPRLAVGPHVLRAHTAPVAAVAALTAVTGEARGESGQSR
jgi:16S rRNA (uracil1498-N3)-methyltransferase